MILNWGGVKSSVVVHNMAMTGVALNGGFFDLWLTIHGKALMMTEGAAPMVHGS